MEEHPVPLPDGSLGRSCAQSKGRRNRRRKDSSPFASSQSSHIYFLLRAWHQAPVTAIPTPSSTSVCRGWGGGGKSGGGRDGGSREERGFSLSPHAQLKIWGIQSSPFILPPLFPRKGQLALGHNAPLQGHLSPPVSLYYFCTLF